MMDHFVFVTGGSATKSYTEDKGGTSLKDLQAFDGDGDGLLVISNGSDAFLIDLAADTYVSIGGSGGEDMVFGENAKSLIVGDLETGIIEMVEKEFGSGSGAGRSFDISDSIELF